MKCDECQNSLISYLEGDLKSKERADMDEHISSCAQCDKEFREISKLYDSLGRLPKPSAAMKQRFDATLEAYKVGQSDRHAFAAREQKEGPVNVFCRIWRNGYAQAASIAIAFLFGIAAGGWESETGADDRIDSIEAELSSLKEFTAFSLLSQNSASERLRGLEWLGNMDTEDTKVINALYDRLSYDPNINVRQAALDALDRYARNKQVRTNLIALLEEPNSPMIRAELIRLLVRWAERDSLPVLERIAANGEEDESIRELAQWSVGILEGKQNEI